CARDNHGFFDIW
nr:immunoglobulin heavy chain junction region [Macaca mulatta]MOW97385.1 immunoglobulin heavy chain junction region [Macaca mulatta]MOW97958.1 immunoglobulin heavy chain junction region [Macaca mulatta]